MLSALACGQAPPSPGGQAPPWPGGQASPSRCRTLKRDQLKRDRVPKTTARDSPATAKTTPCWLAHLAGAWRCWWQMCLSLSLSSPSCQRPRRPPVLHCNRRHQGIKRREFPREESSQEPTASCVTRTQTDRRQEGKTSRATSRQHIKCKHISHGVQEASQAQDKHAGQAQEMPVGGRGGFSHRREGQLACSSQGVASKLQRSRSCSPRSKESKLHCKGGGRGRVDVGCEPDADVHTHTTCSAQGLGEEDAEEDAGRMRRRTEAGGERMEDSRTAGHQSNQDMNQSMQVINQSRSGPTQAVVCVCAC